MLCALPEPTLFPASLNIAQAAEQDLPCSGAQVSESTVSRLWLQ